MEKWGGKADFWGILTMTDKKARRINVRQKGHAFERFLAKVLSPVFPNAKRHLENQVQEAMGFDLDNTGVFRFQCKAYAKYAPLAKIEEIKDLDGTIPVLVTKGNNLTPLAALPLADFVEILKYLPPEYHLPKKAPTG